MVAEGKVTCPAVRLPRSFPGGVEGNRSNPVTLELCGYQLGINDGIMDIVGTQACPHRALVSAILTNRP